MHVSKELDFCLCVFPFHIQGGSHIERNDEGEILGHIFQKGGHHVADAGKINQMARHLCSFLVIPLERVVWLSENSLIDTDGGAAHSYHEIRVSRMGLSRLLLAVLRSILATASHLVAYGTAP